MYNKELAERQNKYLVELGQRLRDIRTKNSITRREIAETIMVSLATIQKVEQGKQNNIFIIHKIAYYLRLFTGVHITEIFNDLDIIHSNEINWG